ncbi:MAG: single-stranded DNA-binding protein [Crocinitomicaceae bacterium]|nr:single-stranded DNA-binding protein [Crocinitomicaceae bacterium]
MNALRNKVSLIGRLGRDPEMITFDSGKSLTRFSMATHQKYKSKNGEWNEDIQWHNVSAWGALGQRMNEILSKGKKIIVEGRLIHQTYENKNGERKNRTVVEANEFMLFDPLTHSEQDQNQAED